MSEVYIRSQDKEKLLMLGSNGILRYCRGVNGNGEHGHGIGFETESEIYALGEYESKARCLEILDEIQTTCGSYARIGGGAALLRGGLDVQPSLFVIPRVYEMPKK